MLIEVVSKSSLFSIIVTVLSILSFMIYYYVKKPKYVMERDENTNEKVFSVRIALLYSLLFSSLIGLIFSAISGVSLYYIKKNEKKE